MRLTLFSFPLLPVSFTETGMPVSSATYQLLSSRVTTENRVLETDVDRLIDLPMLTLFHCFLFVL